MDMKDTINAAAVSDATEGACPATGYQKATICVPVTVKPFAHAGTPITKCCGEPVVYSQGEEMDGSFCGGEKNGACHFTISQTICVKVPVMFGAEAEVGDTYVDCLGASARDICTDCKAE